MTYRKRRNTDLYIYLVKDLKTGLLRQATEEEKVGKINKTVKNKAAAGGRKKKGKKRKKKMKGGDLHVASDQEINNIKNPKNITYEPRQNTDTNKPILLAVTVLDEGTEETGTAETGTEETGTEETGTEETVPKEPINQADALIQSKNKNQSAEQTALQQTALQQTALQQTALQQTALQQTGLVQAQQVQSKTEKDKANLELEEKEAERKMEALMVEKELKENQLDKKKQSSELVTPTELAKKDITLENIELKPTEPNSKNIKNWDFDYSELISSVKRNTISQVININEQSNLNNELNKINDSDDSDEIKKNKIEENIRNRLDKGIQKKRIKNVAIEIVLPTKEINGKITFKEKTSGGKTVKKKKKQMNKTVKKRKRKIRRRLSQSTLPWNKFKSAAKHLHIN
jgi:hypothetical protein